MLNHENILYYFIFVFFSIRRRHTRFSRDWSSDVCSSDLQLRQPGVAVLPRRVDRPELVRPLRQVRIGAVVEQEPAELVPRRLVLVLAGRGSVERVRLDVLVSPERVRIRA